ncbi:MAG: rRNA maturation RNase YbeY [Clostridia bacterium]|nr:rRNA maturation RNase YbeY [Clostridia bacterium]
MKISYLNQQSEYKVGKNFKDLIKKCSLATLKYMGFRTDVEISVVLTDNEGIRTLDSMHRGIDKATDVLSFPMFEYDEDGEIIEDYAEFNEMGELCLGDIVISLERAHEQADEYGHSPEREIGFLTVHSMLHLLGYDHMTPEDEEEMFGYQREILDEIGLVR